MSNEGLTERDFAILGAAFEPSEIGNNGGKAYVKARAIKKRLRMVDPNYKTHVDTYIQVIGDVVTAWGSLTLKGVEHACSKSKNVNCWRKVDDPDTKKSSYVRVDDYEYARELANAIMKATTGLLQRAAETFDVGDYLKDKSSPMPPSLATVMAELRKQHSAPPPSNVTTLPTTTPQGSQLPPPDPPPHWALNGDGAKVRARMNQLGLTWEGDLKSTLEPGKVLAKLSDTTLTYDQVYHKMDEIKAAKVAAELEAQRKAQPPSQKGDEPISVQGDDLQLGDLVYGLGGSHPGRLVYKLGEADDGAFTSWAVWKNTQFTDTVSAMLFEHRLRFKVTRTAEPLSLPDKILSQIESLKAEHASLTEGSITTL